MNWIFNINIRAIRGCQYDIYNVIAKNSTRNNSSTTALKIIKTHFVVSSNTLKFKNHRLVNSYNMKKVADHPSVSCLSQINIQVLELLPSENLSRLKSMEEDCFMNYLFIMFLKCCTIPIILNNLNDCLTNMKI